MGLKQICHEHCPGGTGANWDALAGIVAAAGACVLAINVWLWAWPYIKVVAMCVGMAVIGYVIARVYVAYRKVKARYYASLPAAERPQVQYVQQPMMQPRQQQALPPAQVHHHHGHTLVVSDPEQVAQFLRKGEQ